MDSIEWERLKTAAVEYSGYRPLLTHQVLTPAAGTTDIVPPEGTIGIESCDYGEEMTFTEVKSAPEGTIGWCFQGGDAPPDGSPRRHNHHRCVAAAPSTG